MQQALTIGGISFTDRRVSYEEVASMRAAGKLPNGQVPMLEIDGVAYGQSKALLCWAGRQAGLYTDELQLQIDSVEGTIVDIGTALNPQWYHSALPRNPRTGELVAAATLDAAQQAGVQKALNEDILPARFAQLEQMLIASGGPYMCGSQLTTCDLSLYVIISGLLEETYCDGISRRVLDVSSVLLYDKADRHSCV
eukprot:COSAG02_NODE_7626_length_2927_cov_6.608911_1_plen_196_part_00